MKVLSDIYNDLPEYYDTMYLDGYTAEQILMSARKSMVEEHMGSDDITEIMITTKEKIK